MSNPPDRLSQNELVPLVIFHVQDRGLALPVAQVVQIVRMVAVTPMPDAPPGLLGVINLHGRLTPVLDLQIRLGLDPRPPRLSTRILITQVGATILGILADSVSQVVSVSPSAIENVRPPFNHSSLITQLARIDDHLIQILNPTQLSIEMATLAEAPHV